VASVLSKADAEALLFREARLLDQFRLDEWLQLFTADGLYWIPIDESKPPRKSASIVYDDAPSREERVYHLLHLPFPAQNPRSRTVHVVGNVEITAAGEATATIQSSQVIYEMRTGDYSQIGLGELNTIVARVEHELRHGDDGWRIALKKILLIDRDMPQGNLTFML
jgi:3-phenylpropionate/cinnamic acid dioxygenase small subunit